MNRPLPENPLGLVLCALAVAATVVLLGWLLLDAGSASCPADTGTVPARTLDGRTLCVTPGAGR